MRVAVVANHDPDDVSRWAGTPFHIVRTLRRRVSDLVVVSTPRVDRMMHLLNKVALRLGVDLFREPLVTRLYAWHLRRQLIASDADVLISVGATHKICDLAWDGPILHVTDALFGTIVATHDGYGRMSRRSRRLGNAGQVRALQRVTGVYLSSAWAADDAKRRYPGCAAKMRHLPFGANMDDPPDTSGTAKAFRLLFVGGTWQSKGGPEVLQVFAHIRSTVPAATLDIVGVTPPGPAPPGVTVHGRLAKSDPREAAELDALYRRAAFLIVLSKHEAFGIVFCEAAGYGIPAIATNVGGIPAIIDHGRTGLMFAADDDPARIAADIIALNNDPAGYARYAKAARKRFETKLNWDAWGDVILPEIRCAFAARRASF